jgi:hypothetical protein
MDSPVVDRMNEDQLENLLFSQAPVGGCAIMGNYVYGNDSAVASIVTDIVFFRVSKDGSIRWQKGTAVISWHPTTMFTFLNPNRGTYSLPGRRLTLRTKQIETMSGFCAWIGTVTVAGMNCTPPTGRRR